LTSPATTADIDAFLSQVSQLRHLWNSVDVRALAVHLEDGWHNVLTRCYLDPRAHNRVTRFPSLPVTSRVGCWQHVFALDRLRELLTGVGHGELVIGEQTVTYRAIEAPPSAQSYSFNGSTFNDLSERFRLAYRHWSSLSLGARGNTVWDIVKKVDGGRSALDNEVRAHTHPFDGLSGLAQFALGSPEPFTETATCWFEIFAPLQALLIPERCRYHGGELTFAIRAGSKAVEGDVSLGVFAVGRDPVPYTSSVELGKKEWRKDGSVWATSGSLRPGRGQILTLILRLGGYAVHRLTLFDVSAGSPSPQLAAYRVFDADLSVLTSSLTQEGSAGSSNFERAVARLLTAVGFQVDLLSGDRRLDEAVDLVAYLPSANVCVGVECTIASIGAQGKPGKLVARLQAIANSVPTMDVWGALASPLDRSRLATADLETAAKDGLIVLAQEDLSQLLLFASNVAPVSDVLSFLRSRIPAPRSSESKSTRLNWS